MKTSKEFKLMALDALKGRWGEAILIFFIVSIINSIGVGGLNINVNLNDRTLPNFIFNPVFLWMFIAFMVIGLIVSIAVWAVNNIVSLGAANVVLKIADRRYVSVNMLFSYFPHWKNILKTAFIRDITIVVWSFLCLIPGIVVAYNYAMVPFILAENPGLTSAEVLTKSKEMMRGNRLRYFCLEISFIGWILLSVFTCGLGIIPLTPYMEVSKAVFYREISGTEIRFDAFANDGNSDFGI